MLQKALTADRILMNGDFYENIVRSFKGGVTCSGANSRSRKRK
jgi:hypothetical protein